MEYTFTALDPQGSTIQERLRAETEEEAVKLLHNRGFIVLALTSEGKQPPAAAATATRRTLSLGRAPRIKPEQVVALTREFAIMIETGVPLIEALDLLVEHNADGPIKEALVATRNGLATGESMAQAMSAHPRVFPKLYVDMIRTAELGGRLDETLNQAADYQEYSLEMRRKVRGALTYPAVLVSFAGIVVTFMLVYLIPQFHNIYAQMHAEVPATTKFLFMVSTALRTHWWMIPLGLGVGFPVLKSLLAMPVCQKIVLQIMHRLPVIGDTITKVGMARLLRALGTLLTTGVPLLSALEAAAQTTQDPLYEQAFQQVRAQVEQGRSLAAAMSDTGVIPGLVCQMVAVGEKSGRLSYVLERITRYYEQEVDARLKALTSVLEPIMVALIGVVVGFVAVSIISPIYSVLDTIK
jgi:type IV pilus assembly protein PilC